MCKQAVLKANLFRPNQTHLLQLGVISLVKQAAALGQSEESSGQRSPFTLGKHTVSQSPSASEVPEQIVPSGPGAGVESQQPSVVSGGGVTSIRAHVSEEGGAGPPAYVCTCIDR